MQRILSRYTKQQPRRWFSQHIVSSPTVVPELSTPLVNVPLPKFMLKDFCSADRKDLVAIVDGQTNSSLTFQNVHDSCYSFAETLRTWGLKQGDGVAIISPNTMHYTSAFLGTSLAGFRSTCVNPLASEAEILAQVTETNTKLIFAHPFNLKTVSNVAAKVPGCSVVVFDDELQHDSFDPAQSVVSGKMSEFIGKQISSIDQDSFLPTSSFDPHSVVTVPFSSGTTGKMKGVLLTHRNLVSNILQIMPYEGNFMRASPTKQRGSLLCPLPFFHIYGLVAGLLTTHYAGAKLVFTSVFDLPKFLELVQQHKITRGFVVPPIVLALAKHPIVDKYDLSSLECLMSGAAPLGEDIQTACADRLNCIVKQAWGMTEISPAGALTPDDHIESIASLKGTSGKLVAGTQAKIVSTSTGEDLHYTHEGELLIRGPQVMKGYLNNADATHATLLPDGWMRTGDIAKFDEDGWLYITDRLKELIKYKGFQVPPAELEAVILGMPEVKDVIVIPVEDEAAGEIPRAYVVKQDNCRSDFSEQDVIAYVQSTVAPHKKLRGGVRFVDSVPKSPSGKLLRRVQLEMDRAMD